MHKLLLLSCSLLFQVCCAQQWKNYTSALQVNCIKIDRDTVWVGSEGGVAKYLTDGTRLATYTRADGLASNYVTSIAIDAEGNKWFGTGRYDKPSNGVSKFDGSTWTTYNPYNSGLSDSVIYNILVDKDNDKWFFCGNNKYCELKGANWITYTSADSALTHGYAPMVDSHGNLWYGLTKFDGTTLTKYTFPYSSIGPRCFAMDSHDNIWVGATYSMPGTQGGLFKFDGTNWTDYSSAMGVFPQITMLAIDSQDNLWMSNGCLVKFNGTTVINYCNSSTNSNTISEGQISAIAVDSDQNVWVGTVNYVSGVEQKNSLSKFDGNNWSRYNPSNSGLKGNYIGTLEIDKHNNKWMSVAYGNGLVKFSNNSWAEFDAIGVMDYDTYPIGIGNGDKLWINSNEFDGTNMSYHQPTTSFSPNNLAIDETGSTWFTTNWDGISKFDGVNWVTYNTSNSGIASNTVSCVAIDNLQNKWFGTNNGLTKFDGISWTTYNTTNSGIPANSVYAIAVDTQNNFWIGTNMGVSKFDGINWTNYNNQNSGLPGNIVHFIAVDKTNHKWFASYNATPSHKYCGITWFDDINWATYTIHNSGLAENYAASIKVDLQNNIWIATQSGLSQMIRSDSIYSVCAQFYQKICNNNTITLNPVLSYGTPPFTFYWQSTGDLLSCNNCENPTVNITQNSVVSVTVTDADNHIVTDTLHLYACLNSAVNEPLAEQSIIIAPNPATDKLTVKTSLNDITEINIYTTTGALISQTKNPQNLTVEIGQLHNGLYVVEIKTKGTIAKQRLVKM